MELAQRLSRETDAEILERELHRFGRAVLRAYNNQRRLRRKSVPRPWGVSGEDAVRLSRQDRLLLERLRQGPITNAEMAQDLAILRGSARIYDLHKYSLTN